jgi:MoxR-like ATPase
MLVGPTSTGKTTLALFAGRDLGWGTEIMVCDPGMDDKELFGGYARSAAAPDAHTSAAAELLSESLPTTTECAEPSETPRRMPVWAHALRDSVSGQLAATEARLTAVQGQLDALRANADGGGWQAIDGPIARWARRAHGGEQVLLIIDELARGHDSLIAAVMRVLNTYDRDTVTRQGLAIPDDAEGSAAFHIVDLWHTRERLVIPAERVKIIATANLGDRYTGLDLADPAFRRRWTGGWLYLGPYQADTLGEILSDTLELPRSATLIAKMQAVAAQIEEYQRKEDSLIATLDLATLITWGRTTLALAAEMRVAQAWSEAAVDVWLERICPLKGAELDADARAALLRIVAAHAPASIR